MENKQETETKKIWYRSWWGILILVLLWPISLSYWIAKQKWNFGIKVILISFIVIIYIASWGIVASDKQSVVTPTTTSTEIIYNTPYPTKAVTPTNPDKEELLEQVKVTVHQNLDDLKASQTPVSKKDFNIVVTSQIIKKVGKKYRYFFDIRNKDTEPFKGIVRISLYNAENTFITEQSFSSDQLNAGQIESELGMSRYIDANTGPKEIHGVNGISEYKYDVLINKQVVRQGEGDITSNIEDY